ncbi:MAG: alpha/beta hydrolase [Chloroflexi bacterium]|nr:alpha/beta hydrolase [Chloroflexota bacterium]
MTTAPLDLDALVDPAYREALAANPGHSIDLSDGIQAAVDRWRATSMQFEPAPPRPGIAVEDHFVPGPDGAPDVMVRVYQPEGLPKPAAAVYNIHGGGMIGGDVPFGDADCMAYAANLGVIVASVEYRLAPEHPFPAPIEDCYAGLLWLWRHSDALGVDRGRIATRGGSAGGGLAAGLALLARDRGEVEICYQVLVFPMLDDRNITLSSHQITDLRVWSRAHNELGWNAYLEGRAGADDISPYAAPARATDLAGLPPAYISVGTLDLFLDEDVDYSQALAHAGVPVELHVYPGAYHGAHGTVPGAPLSRRWRRDEYQAVERALGGE